MNREAIEYYQSRVTALEAELKNIKSKTSRLYLVRFFTFLLFVALFILIFSGEHTLLYSLASALAFGIFISITIYDLRMSERRRELRRRVDFNEGEIKSMKLEFNSRDNGARYVSYDPHLSADFDIFGKGSIYQYINRSVTRAGKDLFAASLVACDKRHDHIESRSKAIKELSTKRALLESFASLGSEIEESGSEVENLCTWLDEEARAEQFVAIVRYVMPAFTLTSLLLALLGVISYSFVIIAFLISLACVYSATAKLNKAHALLGRSAKIFDKYASLIDLIEHEEFTSPLLASHRAKLATDGKSASDSITALKALLNRFDYRCNIYLSILLNGLFAFDFHTYMALVNWKREYRTSATKWFDALFNIDSLIGFGIYAYNCSDTTHYAELQEGDFMLSAEDMGHPLIAPNMRVNNSIEISGRPAIVIITGANMAGKSTFLRTLAVNMLLAMNGAPVAASAFRFTPIQLFSSIKIQDSLMNRESYFYAELLRLSTILERVDSQPQSMIILDEILRGTNTKDKQQGSIGLLRKVIEKRGVAIIATHDLIIGKLEDEHPECVANYCFEVEIEGDQLSFDYKLKRGISSKLNASFLMRKMGIID